MVLMSVLYCKVFDHLINNVAPSFVNRTSLLANCLVGSKDPTVWGNKLESLRKEKFATNSNVWNLEKYHIVRSKRLKGQCLYKYVSLTAKAY